MREKAYSFVTSDDSALTCLSVSGRGCVCSDRKLIFKTNRTNF